MHSLLPCTQLQWFQQYFVVGGDDVRARLRPLPGPGGGSGQWPRYRVVLLEWQVSVLR